MQRVGALADDLEQVDLRALPHHEVRSGVDLVIGAGRALMALDQRHPRAGLDNDQVAHEGRDRLRADGDRDDVQRPCDLRAGRDADEHAVAHQRRVERKRHVARREILAEMRGHNGLAAAQRRRHGVDRQTAFEPAEIGQLRREHAVHQEQAAAIDPSDDPAGAQRLGLAIGIRRAGERLRIAKQRAQVGVLPLLDLTMRQAGGDEVPERGLAPGSDLAVARQGGLGRGEGVGNGELGNGLEGANGRGHGRHAASSRYCA